VCALTDELQCVSGQWLCADLLQCIPLEYLCNAENDCYDGSDEIACGITHTILLISYDISDALMIR